jgi:hypothetical protein
MRILTKIGLLTWILSLIALLAFVFLLCSRFSQSFFSLVSSFWSSF